MAKTVPPEAPVQDAPIGLEVEVGTDARREAIQRATYQDYLVRQNPKEWVRLANGAAVRAQPGVLPSYDTDQETLIAAMLGRPGGEWYVDTHDRRLKMHQAPSGAPASMLLETKPPYYDKYGTRIGPRYAWKVFNSLNPNDPRTAETRNLHGRDAIRYVEASEINRECPFAVYTKHPAGDTFYVMHMTMILVEIMDPMIAYKMEKAPEDKALSRAMSASRDIAGSPSLGDGLITSVPGKFGTKLVVQDTREGG